MASRVELEFRRAARELIPADASVVAAVSGGSDSVALLHLLLQYGRTRGLSITVAHLDHALRRGSVSDQRFVERLASGLGLACVSERRDVKKLRRKGESKEEAARRVRRGFLTEVLAQLGADVICTGHTLDDQAETVILRLVRGAGATGLAGMRAEGPGPFVRPLLELERQELREYLARRELPFRDDPSNRDLRFDRNRVRHLVVPFLQGTLNPRAARHLVAAADRLRLDAEYLDQQAAQRYRRVAVDAPAGEVLLDVRKLRATAAPIARRVARLALQAAGADPRRIASTHIEALLSLAAGPGAKQLHLPSRIAARRTDDRRIRLRRL